MDTILTATTVTRAAVVRAVTRDALRWVAPFASVAIVLSVPFLASLTWLVVAVSVVAVLVSAGLVLSDARALAQYGYTESLRKRGYRVIDADTDTVLYKARFARKSLVKLALGRYQVIAL